MSDHFAIAIVRRAKLLKPKPRLILKRDVKHFCEQAFHHVLWHFDWSWMSLFDDVELAWKYFYDVFNFFINKHAPLRKFRVKRRNNPWFTAERSSLLNDRDDAWAKARHSKSQSDWLLFKQIRNRFSSLVKKAESQFYVDKTTVVYWGWSPSNSLCVDDAGRTLLTQSWSNTETFIVNQVRVRITDLMHQVWRDVSSPDSPKSLTY